MAKNFVVVVLILILLSVSVFFGVSSYKSKERELEFNGTVRKYRLHVPSGYYEKDSYPLIIALHGFTDNPRLLEINSGFSTKADEEGFFVVYPYGSKKSQFMPRTWNAKFCCGDAVDEKVDDVGFISRIIEDTTGTYNINKDRIYVVGLSNGGMLAHQIALQIPDKIAAGAVVAGAVGGQKEGSEQYVWLDQSGIPIPMIIFHGREDPTVPFDGGMSRWRVINFTAAYDEVNLWLQNNKCDTHPSEITKTDNYTKEVYGQCANGADVVFYAMNNKHVWPGGWQEFPRNFSSRTVRATDLIWEFFSARKK